MVSAAAIGNEQIRRAVQRPNATDVWQARQSAPDMACCAREFCLTAGQLIVRFQAGAIDRVDTSAAIVDLRKAFRNLDRRQIAPAEWELVMHSAKRLGDLTDRLKN